MKHVFSGQPIEFVFNMCNLYSLVRSCEHNAYLSLLVVELWTCVSTGSASAYVCIHACKHESDLCGTVAIQMRGGSGVWQS